MKSFYIKKGGQTKGPYSLVQLRSMWREGVVNKKTDYCEEGGDKWRSLVMMESVLEEASASSAQTKTQDPESGSDSRRVFYYVAGGIVLLILAILFLRMFLNSGV